jgi:hypothetical protein
MKLNPLAMIVVGVLPILASLAALLTHSVTVDIVALIVVGASIGYHLRLRRRH